MEPESNRLFVALFAAGVRAQLDSFLRCVELAQGEVLAEPLQRIQRVYFPFSGLISFLVPLTDGSLIQTGLWAEMAQSERYKLSMQECLRTKLSCRCRALPRCLKR